MNKDINGFVDWAKKSFFDHPVYTVIFGACCFLGGVFFVAITGV